MRLLLDIVGTLLMGLVLGFLLGCGLGVLHNLIAPLPPRPPHEGHGGPVLDGGVVRAAIWGLGGAAVGFVVTFILCLRSPKESESDKKPAAEG